MAMTKSSRPPTAAPPSVLAAQPAAGPRSRIGREASGPSMSPILTSASDANDRHNDGAAAAVPALALPGAVDVRGKAGGPEASDSDSASSGYDPTHRLNPALFTLPVSDRHSCHAVLPAASTLTRVLCSLPRVA
jgi:hypothetical protein